MSDDRDPTDYTWCSHPLTDAVKNNSLEEVEAWLTENPIEVKNVHLGALILAVQDEARLPIFERLLQVPGTYDFQAGNCQVLRAACDSGCVGYVQKLLAMPAVRDCPLGPSLISAAYIGNLEMVNCLLENNADVNAPSDGWGPRNPLCASVDAENFQADVFQRLLQCEALNAESVTTAANRAILQRRTGVIEQLLAHPLCNGADPELIKVAADGQNWGLVERLAEWPGATPIVIFPTAIYQKQQAWVDRFIDADWTGAEETDIGRAAMAAGNVPVLRRLFERFPAMAEQKDRAYVSAAGHGSLEVMQFFIEEMGVAVNTLDNAALTEAAQERKMDVVEWLLAQPGVAPTEEAAVSVAQRGNFELAKRFIELGVPASTNNQQILVQALFSDNQEMVNWLLTRPDVNFNEEAFKTCIHRDNFDLFKARLELQGMDAMTEDIFALAVSNSLRIAQLLVNSPVAERGFTRLITEVCDSYYNSVETVNKCRELGFDPNPILYSIIREKLNNGEQYRVRELVMNFPEIDYSVDNNYLVRTAIRQRQEELVQLLLQSPGVDATANDSEEIMNYFEQCLAIDDFTDWYGLVKYVEMGISFRGRDDYILRTLASTGKGSYLFNQILERANLPKEFLNELMRVANANGQTMVKFTLRSAGADEEIVLNEV
eukprot:TRINITY_DN11788_c0_g1_i1.p1 TRINITY_DN11788_c0_g1~~TRINITY_DN11788_c0_g1_i1.p1  ORF type:complete len:680 (+),score=225.95 TRINITY_DN11788_c0_g1_i1:61-2040(+)